MKKYLLDIHKNIYTLKIILFTIVILFTVSSCQRNNNNRIIYAHGQYGDIIVVMTDERWNSESGDALRNIFGDNYKGVPMEEDIMDMHPVNYADFGKINKYHKNIIYQEVDSNLEKSTFSIIYNKFAENQVLVLFKVKSQTDFVNLVNNNKEKLLETFLNADRERWQKQLLKYTNQSITNTLLNKYDISIKIPKGYKLDVEDENFAWISKETQKHAMNIIVYTYPITEESDFDANYLIRMRDANAKKNLPGQLKGSYMITEIEFEYPSLKIIEQNYSPTAVLQGLWKMENDFMGGGFISYTKKDEARNRYVTVEGFVYSPNEAMRDQIRQLEGILHTFDITK